MKLKKYIFMAGLLAMLLVPALTAAAAQEMNDGDAAAIAKAAKLETIAIGEGTTILGAPEATQEQMVRYILQQNPEPKLNCSVEELVRYYYEEGAASGIRPDVALCQAIKETGCFAYGKDVVPEQNNYCGLGATGKGYRGAYFATPQRGVRAHLQHLMAYATTQRPQGELVDPRYDVLRLKYPKYYGKIPYWTGLDGKWALPGTHYGEDILARWEEAKQM